MILLGYENAMTKFCVQIVRTDVRFPGNCDVRTPGKSRALSMSKCFREYLQLVLYWLGIS